MSEFLKQIKNIICCLPGSESGWRGHANTEPGPQGPVQGCGNFLWEGPNESWKEFRNRKPGSKARTPQAISVGAPTHTKGHFPPCVLEYSWAKIRKQICTSASHSGIPNTPWWGDPKVTRFLCSNVKGIGTAPGHGSHSLLANFYKLAFLALPSFVFFHSFGFRVIMAVWPDSLDLQKSW